MSDMLRITGMASGLDVDSIVKQLMTAENTKVDKVKQDKQTLQWTQDAYRDIIGDINTFKSSYFDILKKDTYMLSGNNYAGFDVTSVDSSNSSSAPGATATGGAGAAAGLYQVTVNQLAKAAIASGNNINGSQSTAVNLTGGSIAAADIANWANKNFIISAGSASVNITLGNYSGDTSFSTIINDINNQISNSSLNGLVSISSIVNSDGTKGTMQFNTTSSTPIKLSNNNISALNGISDGYALNPSSSTLLTDMGANLGGKMLNLNLTYNGTTANVAIDNTNNDKTMNDIINAVATQTSGNVIASFSQLTGQFTLKTNNMGNAASLTINAANSSSDLLSALGNIPTTQKFGQDANVTITPPGGSATTITKSSNNFTIDGISYNLNKEATTTNINLTQNVQKTFDKIKDFIDKYNDLIDKISTQISQKKQYDYKPLTDTQKESMKDSDITAWEAKAKEGLLSNDSSLENILYNMRSAFFAGVNGSGISLSQIGLSTSSDYTEKGKIIIDETKLKDALQNNGAQVASLFMKSSSTAYDPSSHSTSRYNEEGIFQRINDVIQDYTRTIRDDNGKKGLLLEKAGLKGDVSEFTNLLSTEMSDKDDMIKDLTQKLSDKQNQYYLKYSKLETAMQQLNNQQSWLTQQLGGMSQSS